MAEPRSATDILTPDSEDESEVEQLNAQAEAEMLMSDAPPGFVLQKHRAAIDQLVAAAAATPVRMSPEAAGDQAVAMPSNAVRLLVVSLVRQVQSLSHEVESGRAELLDAQAALASVLRRVQVQDEN